LATFKGAPDPFAAARRRIGPLTLAAFTRATLIVLAVIAATGTVTRILKPAERVLAALIVGG
jgi:hypothetical protein